MKAKSNEWTQRVMNKRKRTTYHSEKILAYARVLSDTGERKYMGTCPIAQLSKCPDRHSKRSYVIPEG